MILVDSDHLSVLIDRRDARHGRLAGRLAEVRDDVLIPVVAMEEHLRGWLAQIQRLRDPLKLVGPYGRLVQLVSFLGEWETAGWTEDAAAEFSALRASRVRIGTQDLRIASIALVNDALLLSANLRDFEQVPGLQVEDWLDR
jgi:tRNA(fMet)-specific endonuclease VapC